MKETGVIFNSVMVQADLDGRKSMTRRIRGLERINQYPDQWLCDGKMNENGLFTFASDQLGKEIDVKCPYGRPGDLIWVKETYFPAVKFRMFPQFSESPDFLYKADGSFIGCQNWNPSIFMPKSAARIWLQIVSIRTERLQDISEEDAIAEGLEIIEEGCNDKWYRIEEDSIHFRKAWYAFKHLWIRINDNESWHANPWVWRIEFRVLSKSGKPDIIPNL